MTDVSQITPAPTPAAPPVAAPQAAPVTPPAAPPAIPPVTPVAAAPTPDPATPEQGGALADIAKPDATPDPATPPADAAWDLKPPEGMPEGLTFKDEDMKAFTDIMKADVPPQEKAKNLLEFEAKRVAGMMEAQQQAFAQQHKDWGAQLQKEYGDKFPAAQQNAKKAFTKFGPADQQAAKQFADDMVAFGIGNYPHLFRWAASVGAAMGQDSSGGGSGGSGQGTPEQQIHQQFPLSTNPDGSLKKGVSS